MESNNTIKKDIKAMLIKASLESGIPYKELLDDFSTLMDITSIFDISDKEAITITNELLKEAC